MARTPTTPANIAEIEKFVAKIQPLFLNLFSRWLDEKGHEDIVEYGARIARELPAGWSMVKMSKRPFGFVFNIGTEAEYMICATTRSYGWKRTV